MSTELTSINNIVNKNKKEIDTHLNALEVAMNNLLEKVNSYEEELNNVKEEKNNLFDEYNNYFSNLITNFINYVTPEMYGAKGDGSTDDTNAIQSAFNSNKNVTFVANKTYKITSPIIFTNKKGITIDGKCATILHTKSAAIYVNSIEGLENCVIKNINFHSAGAKYHGIAVESIKGSKYFNKSIIENCTFNGEKYGIYFCGEQNEIKNCYFTNCEYGIYDDCANILNINNCYFFSNIKGGLNLQSPYFTTVRNNKFYANGIYGILCAGSSTETVPVTCTIQNNAFFRGDTQKKNVGEHIYIIGASNVQLLCNQYDGKATNDIHITATGNYKSNNISLTNENCCGTINIDGQVGDIYITNTKCNRLTLDPTGFLYMTNVIVTDISLPFVVQNNWHKTRFLYATNVECREGTLTTGAQLALRQGHIYSRNKKSQSSDIHRWEIDGELHKLFTNEDGTLSHKKISS